MVELRRDTYLDEESGKRKQSFEATKELAADLIQAAAMWLRR